MLLEYSSLFKVLNKFQINKTSPVDRLYNDINLKNNSNHSLEYYKKRTISKHFYIFNKCIV